jgi:hypothetical protein
VKEEPPADCHTKESAQTWEELPLVVEEVKKEEIKEEEEEQQQEKHNEEEEVRSWLLPTPVRDHTPTARSDVDKDRQLKGDCNY